MLRTLTALSLLLILSVNGWSFDGVRKEKGRVWLTGAWEGTGYQTDDKSTWTMILRAHSGAYSIAYPSLNCGGEWVLKRLSGNKAIFTERLSSGTDQCANNGQVVIERLSDQQLLFLYRNAGEKQVTASAILNRKSEGDPMMNQSTKMSHAAQASAY